jgi:hypothetical protein
MEEKKIINVTIKDPRKNMFATKNGRQRVMILRCSHSENCDIFKKKQCIRLETFKHFCPYGDYEVIEGFTPRAKNYVKFLNDAKEKYSEYVNQLTCISKVGFENVGDYVYVPYSFVHLIPGMDKYFLSVGHMFMSEQPFVKKEDFTVEFVRMLIKGEPIAYLGDSITAYQKEEVPKIVYDLKLFSPDLYEQVKDKVQSNQMFNPIGKKALLKTLSPCTIVKGEGKSFESTWKWDGEKMHYQSGFISLPTNAFPETVSCSYIPSDKEEEIVSSLDQVNENTKYVW